jgi:hypothetical protein
MDSDVSTRKYNWATTAVFGPICTEGFGWKGRRGGKEEYGTGKKGWADEHFTGWISSGTGRCEIGRCTKTPGTAADSASAAASKTAPRPGPVTAVAKETFTPPLVNA